MRKTAALTITTLAPVGVSHEYDTHIPTKKQQSESTPEQRITDLNFLQTLIEESAGKIKSRRITHGNKYIRKTMIECAWGASRTQNCFYSNFSYTQTVVRRKNAMKVKVAIARKMLVVIWHVLSDGVPYNDYKKPEAIAEGNS